MWTKRTLTTWGFSEPPIAAKSRDHTRSTTRVQTADRDIFFARIAPSSAHDAQNCYAMLTGL